MIINRFNKDKALEVILYVASKVEYMYHTGKIIYFSNREHLDRYGRFVFDDSVIAMKYGPVLSGWYDIVKSARGISNKYPDVAQSLSYLADEKLDKLIPKRKPNMDYFSKSDIKVLDEQIEKLKDMTFKELCDYSHDNLYNSANYNDEISIESIIAHSKNPEELKEYLAG